MNKSLIKRTSRFFIAVIIIIITMWGVSFIFSSKLVPSPFEIIKNIVYNVNKILFIHTMKSVLRLLKAIVISVVISVPIGIIMGYMPRLNRYLSPLFYFSYPVPKLALLPLIMLFFGLGETTKIIMMVIIMVFPMTVQVRDSIYQIEPSVFEPYMVIGMSTFYRILLVTLKGLFPALLSSMRVGVGTALSVLFFSENFGTNYGIGYYIMDSWMRMDYLDMYSGIVIISLVGVLFFSIIDWLEKRVCTWKRH